MPPPRAARPIPSVLARTLCVMAEETLSYEKARDELAEVVKRLETGGLTLEESLGLWERGEKLAGICEEWLEGARARLAAAMAPKDGDAEAPF